MKRNKVFEFFMVLFKKKTTRKQKEHVRTSREAVIGL